MEMKIMAENNGWRTIEFDNGGGAFHFPPGLEYIEVIQITKPPEQWPDPLDSTFKIDGFVIQFEFTSSDDGDVVPDKPFILEVRYRQEDLDRAGNSCLQLGIHKNDEKGWKNLSKSVREEGDFKDPAWIGYWKVEIPDWSTDPLVTWGP